MPAQLSNGYSEPIAMVDRPVAMGSRSVLDESPEQRFVFAWSVDVLTLAAVKNYNYDDHKIVFRMCVCVCVFNKHHS